MKYKKIKIESNISDDKLFELVDNLNHTVEENEICEYLDVKHSTFEIKEKVFKKLLSSEDIKNPIFILNVLNLIKNYNDFDDSFFSNDLIYFESIVEHLDMRINLDSDIYNLQKKVALYYLSLFSSIERVEYTILDEYEELPQFIKALFLTSNIITMSGIISRVKDLNIKEFLQIKNANFYLTNLLNEYTLSGVLVNSLNDNSVKIDSKFKRKLLRKLKVKRNKLFNL